MKIKMYTKTIEKTMCIVYDNIDDIDMADGEDISKIAFDCESFADPFYACACDCCSNVKNCHKKQSECEFYNSL